MNKTGTENRIDPKHLIYLQDVPLYDDKYYKMEDRVDQFKHSGYIESLYNLSLECPTPYCIGLFGGWGTGKTGIVKGLIKKGHKNDKNGIVRFLYFDVWKHSADSLRRQLLIEIDKQWHQGKLEFEKKLYVNSTKKTDFKTSFSWKKFFKTLWYLAPIFIAIFLLAYFQSPTGWAKDWVNVIGTAILPVILAFITAIQSEGETNSIIDDISKPTSLEEFEKLFINSIDKEGGIRNVFILDNLDRIDNEKVMEVLSGISTFLDEQSCIYIIPCDEKRLKIHLCKSLKIDNDAGSHQDDFLRKLFNVQIHLRPLVEDQLVNYVNQFIIKIGIQEKAEIEALQTILIVGLSKNPRRVLQFLNNFVATYNLVYDIEYLDIENASLPKGIVSNNKGFLAKVIFIRDYFSEAFFHFESNIGSYFEAEELIKTQQIETSTAVYEELEKILNLDYEGFSLRRFLNATSDIRDSHPDLFFRLSGNTDIVNVESANDIINSFMTKDIDRSNELILKKLDNKIFLNELENQISEILKSNKTSDSLKINIISSILQINEKIPDNKLVQIFSGNLISPLPDGLLKKVGDEIRPVIWKLSSVKSIKREKTQSIGRIVYSSLNKVFEESPIDKNGPSVNDLQRIWSKLNHHLKAISENFEVFDQKGQRMMRELVVKLINYEVLSKNTPNIELWNWVLPENNEIPDIFKDHDSLLSIAKSLPSLISENTRNAGLLISKLNEYSSSESIHIIVQTMSKLFNQEYNPNTAHLFPPNIIREWIINSNKTFDSSLVDQLFNNLINNEIEWKTKAYDLEESWIDGFIELYDKAEEPLDQEILTKIINRIHTEPKEYIIQFTNSYFNNYYKLNYEALITYTSSVNIEDQSIKDELLPIIKELIEKVFEYKSEPIFENILENLWKRNKPDSVFLSIEISIILSREYSKIDDPTLLIKNAIMPILNNKFWANATDQLRESHLKPYLEILNQDSRIKQAAKDNIIEPFLKSFQTEIKVTAFKEQLTSLRIKLFGMLSVNAKKHVLNQIWTSYLKLTGVKIDDPDFSFLMLNFSLCGEGDKKEILSELLEQLNSNQPGSIDLFIKFGLDQDVIKISPDYWLDELNRYLDQYDDTNSQRLVLEISNNIDNLISINEKFNNLKQRLSALKKNELT